MEKEMKRNIYVMLAAAGITLVTGCMSLEEIKAAKAKAEAERKEARAKAEAERFVRIKALADAGNGEMAYRTALMLEKGMGVKADPQQAFVYFEKAVKSNNIPAAWFVMFHLCKTGDTAHSELFGDCNQVLWNSFWKTRGAEMERDWYKNKKYKTCILCSLKYFDLLQKAGKDAETYALKKRLITVVCSKFLYDSYTSSISEEYESCKEIKDYFDKLTKIKTETEERKLKYPSEDISGGVKLYKNIMSGISLEYFIWKTLQNKGKVRDVGTGSYSQQYKSTIYPDISFWFSSSRRKPKTGNISTVAEYYRLNRDWFDLKGCLYEIEISLPKNIDEKKVFNKLCKDYPHIKPVFKKKDMNKQVGGCVLKAKGGRYIWEDDKVYVSFTFADYAGVTGSNPYLVNRLKQEGQDFGVRTIVIRDKKLLNQLVVKKIEKDKLATKAKKDAAQNAALDF